MHKYTFNDKVIIDLSNITGLVIGYSSTNGLYPNSYLVTYLNAQGDFAKSWFDEQDLSLSLT